MRAMLLTIALTVGAHDWAPRPAQAADLRPIIWAYKSTFPCYWCERGAAEWDHSKFRRVDLPYACPWALDQRKGQGYPVYHFRTGIGNEGAAIYGWRGREAFEAEYRNATNMWLDLLMKGKVKQ